MAGYGITPVDVKNAINDQNLELPSGSIEGNTMELTLRTMGQMHTAKEFNNIILKEQNGQVVRFSDIGYAELGPADIKSYMKMNGVPMVGVVVIPQPASTTLILQMPYTNVWSRCRRTCLMTWNIPTASIIPVSSAPPLRK